MVFFVFRVRAETGLELVMTGRRSLKNGFLFA
jgi:hypothetical protein